MKVAILAPAAFAVGLVGGAFAMKGKAAPAPAEHDAAALAPDSLATGETAAATPDTSIHPVTAPGEVPPATKTEPAPGPAGTPPTATVPAEGAAGTTRSTAEAKRLADILAKLPPADVLPLIKDMSDTDLLPVLGFMDLSHAGGILGVLPPERAARISKQLLKQAAGGKP